MISRIKKLWKKLQWGVKVAIIFCLVAIFSGLFYVKTYATYLLSPGELSGMEVEQVEAHCFFKFIENGLRQPEQRLPVLFGQCLLNRRILGYKRSRGPGHVQAEPHSSMEIYELLPHVLFLLLEQKLLLSLPPGLATV